MKIVQSVGTFIIANPERASRSPHLSIGHPDHPRDLANNMRRCRLTDSLPPAGNPGCGFESMKIEAMTGPSGVSLTLAPRDVSRRAKPETQADLPGFVRNRAKTHNNCG
jgi:hypothetical protein